MAVKKAPAKKAAAKKTVPKKKPVAVKRAEKQVLAAPRPVGRVAKKAVASTSAARAAIEARNVKARSTNKRR